MIPAGGRHAAAGARASFSALTLGRPKLQLPAPCDSKSLRVSSTPTGQAPVGVTRDNVFTDGAGGGDGLAGFLVYGGVEGGGIFRYCRLQQLGKTSSSITPTRKQAQRGFMSHLKVTRLRTGGPGFKLVFDGQAPSCQHVGRWCRRSNSVLVVGEVAISSGRIQAGGASRGLVEHPHQAEFVGL